MISPTVTLPEATAVNQLVANLNRDLLDKATKPAFLNERAKAFQAISWSRLLCEQVGIRKLNLLLARLKHSQVDKSPPPVNGGPNFSTARFPQIAGAYRFRGMAVNYDQIFAP